MSRETTNQKTADYIQPDRQPQIARLIRRKQIALIIWLGATLLVFEYLWVFNYETYATPDAGLRAVLMASIFPAIIGAFYYFNERRTVNPKIQRLLKYDILFDEFFEAMITEMESNDAEKGDSWRTIDEPELRKLQNRKINQLQSKKRTVADDFDFQKELANYCAMIWIRGRELE